MNLSGFRVMNHMLRSPGLWAALAIISVGPATSSELERVYPETRADPLVETLHGVEVADPYRWLEAGDAEEVRAWTAAQNALTRAALDRFGELRRELRAELDALYDSPTLSTPRIHGQRYFFTRREPGENHAAVYVRERGMSGEARRLMNPNDWDPDGAAALDWWYPSPNGDLIAYGRSSGGDELSTLYLYDARAAADAALVIPRTRAGSIAWDADGRGFHYVQYPAAGEVPEGDELLTRRVKYHRFGTSLESNPIVFGDGRPRGEWCDVYNGGDDAWQFISASSDWSRNDVYFRRNEPDATFEPLVVDQEAHFECDSHAEVLYVRTSLDAKRFRIAAIDPEAADLSAWRTIVPQQNGVIESFVIAGRAPRVTTTSAEADGEQSEQSDSQAEPTNTENESDVESAAGDSSGEASDDPSAPEPARGVRLVVQLLDNVASRLRIFDLDGNALGEIELPHSLGQVTGLSGKVGDPRVYYTFESFTHPPALYSYNLETGKSELIERVDLPVNSGEFDTRQIWFESKDGTRVPMFVMHRTGMKLDGHAPTLLYGYGGFEISEKPAFSPAVIPWLRRGGVYAVANLRGGGEFGREWHEAGRLGNKQNVFDDMIAAAEKLIADGYTRPERLGIQGGSNGGLLVGAVLTQRPDLVGAVYCAVPLLDMLRYDRFLIGSLWVPEYGSPGDPKHFAWLHAYSPYHNVRDGTVYPATLIVTAESDSRVDPCHARKMAARLQAASTGDAPIMLWIETRAGHGAGKPLAKRIDDQVDRLTFFSWRLFPAD